MIDAVEATQETPAEPVRRKRGRPPGSKNKVYEDGNLPPDTREQNEEAADSVEPLGEIEPYPPMAAESSIEAILTVWNECLSIRQKEHGGLYFYREHPVYKRILKHGRLINENIQKFTAADGPVSVEMVRAKHRAGVYRVRLNQRVVKPYGEHSQAVFKIEGDYATTDEMPIVDLERLDVDHPDNKSFVRILKLRGAIKPDENPEEREDMAASEVLGSIASRAIDTLSEQRREQPAPVAAPNDNGAVKEVVSLLRETINNSKPPEQQGSVTDHVKSLVDIAKAMAPPAVDLSPFMTLQQENNRLVEQIMKKDVERAEADAARAKQEAAELRAAMPKAKTLDEQFDDLEKAVTRYKRIRGERDEPEENTAAAPAAPGLGFWGALPAILEKGERILSLVANMGFNFAVIKAGGGAAPVNPATGATETAPAPPELSPEQQEQANRMQNVIAQLVPLAAPLLRQFQAQRTGTEFAKFVFDNYGPETIAIIQGVEGGRQTIMGMLQSYPPVWSVVSANEATLGRFALFLDQFLTYQPSSAPIQ